MWNHMSEWMGEYGWGWGLFGALHMIGFWLLVIGGVWLLARLLSEGGSRREKTPLEILKERYARGEIDKAEYEQRRADLER